MLTERERILFGALLHSHKAWQALSGGSHIMFDEWCVKNGIPDIDELMSGGKRENVTPEQNTSSIYDFKRIELQNLLNRENLAYEELREVEKGFSLFGCRQFQNLSLNDRFLISENMEYEWGKNDRQDGSGNFYIYEIRNKKAYDRNRNISVDIHPTTIVRIVPASEIDTPTIKTDDQESKSVDTVAVDKTKVPEESFEDIMTRATTVIQEINKRFGLNICVTTNNEEEKVFCKDSRMIKRSTAEKMMKAVIAFTNATESFRGIATIMEQILNDDSDHKGFERRKE